MGFWNLIKLWLDKEALPGNSTCSQPISHELLKRDEEDMEAYLDWKSSPKRKEMIHYIANNFEVWKSTPCEQCDCIDFVKMKSFQGFILHFMDLDKDDKDVRHLFDYLKERILALGYKSYVSDVQQFKKTRWIETVERHYLKPSLKLDENGKQQQLYGNINIELLFRDSDPLHMKFGVCTYRDSKFEEANDFEALVEAITSPS